jgi:hypothetical protein
MDDTNIADGIALTLLLAGIVLASGVVGGLGFVSVTSPASTDAITDHAVVEEELSAAFPIDNVTTAFPIDNVTAAFPTDRVTIDGAPWDVRDTSLVRSTGGETPFRLQDMDPYAIPPDELPQDMDPY